MKGLKIIFSIFSSRYLLALSAFTIWIVFFDENNLISQNHRRSELRELNKKVEYYKGQVADTRKELKDLQNDPAMLEKYAREKYYMKRDNEEIFIVEAPKK